MLRHRRGHAHPVQRPVAAAAAMPARRAVLATVTATVTLALPACEQASKARHDIYGEIDADEIDVASRLPGRIRSIPVREGQTVKAGDVLVAFEDDMMVIKKQAATATIAAAQSKQAIAQDAVRPEEKQQLQAAADAAAQQLDFAKKTLARTAVLLKEGAVAQQTYEEVQMKYQGAVAQHDAATAKLRMANAGARAEEKAGANALLDQAKAMLAEVDAYEKDLSLKAPADGIVYKILNHEGELVPTGYPVVTLLKTDQAWITINLPETRLRELPQDSVTSVEVPALGDKQLSGKVTYIAAMANFAAKTFTQDRSSFDLKTFEVRVALDGKPEGLRPGMTAIVHPQR